MLPPSATGDVAGNVDTVMPITSHPAQCTPAPLRLCPGLLLPLPSCSTVYHHVTCQEGRQEEEEAAFKPHT